MGRFIARFLTLAVCVVIGSAGCASTSARPATHDAGIYVSTSKQLTMASFPVQVTVSSLKTADGSFRWDDSTTDNLPMTAIAPVVAGGLVLMPSEQMSPDHQVASRLSARGVADGQERWHVEIGVFLSPPIVVNDVIYVSATTIASPQSKRVAYALRLSDGHTLWQTTLASGNPSLAALRHDTQMVVGDRLYVTSNEICFDTCNHSYLYALQVMDGALSWSHTFDEFSAVPTPLVQGNRVYVVRPDTTLTIPGDTSRTEVILALDATTGATVWHLLTGFLWDFAHGNPLYADDATLYATTYDAATSGGNVDYALLALDAATGQTRWRTTTQAGPQMIGLSDGHIFLTMAQTTATSSTAAASDLLLASYAARDGQMSGSFPVVGSQVLASDTPGIFFVSTTNIVVDAQHVFQTEQLVMTAVDALQRRELWRFTFPPENANTYKQMRYAQAAAGRLYAIQGANLLTFDASHGKLLWKTTLAATINGVTVVP